MTLLVSDSSTRPILQARGRACIRDYADARSAFRADAHLSCERETAAEEVDGVEILWTAVTFGFTVGVLAVVAYALARIATMGRRHQH